jgi:hypothetical protein
MKESKNAFDESRKGGQDAWLPQGNNRAGLITLKPPPSSGYI